MYKWTSFLSVSFIFNVYFFISFPAYGFLNGTWNSHIKSTQPSLGALASSCTYIGVGSSLNGAASYDADLMASEFNYNGHQIWASTFYPNQPFTHCSNANFLNVARVWNLNGTQKNQIAFGIIPKSLFISAGSFQPLISLVSTFSSEQMSLNSAATTAGSDGVTLAIGSDDFQTVLASVLDPNRPLTIKEMRRVYQDIVAPSGIHFLPYFEGLNAMALLTKSVVLGIPSGTTTSHKLFPSSGSGRDELDHTFQFRAGGTTPISLPGSTSRVEISTLIGDGYIRDAILAGGADPVIEVEIGSSSGWRHIGMHSLVNSNGNSNSQFFPVRFYLNNNEILDLNLSRDLQLRFRLKNNGLNATSLNTNVLTIITVPRIKVTHKLGEDEYELSQLMKSHPTLYFSTSSISRPLGRSSSVVTSRLIMEEEQLLSSTLGNALDGAMIKTDSSPDNFSGSLDLIQEVCRSLQVSGKSCMIVSWGSDLQGVSLDLKTEMKRYFNAKNLSDGYIVYNFPLDLAHTSGGIFQQQISSIPNAARFHWPLDTRGLDGYDHSLHLKIPASSPIGGSYELNVALSSPSSCSLNGSGQKIWSIGLRVPSDPSSDFSGEMIKDASGAVFSSRQFFPAPGDIIELHFLLEQSVGSSRCDLEMIITPPSGYSFPVSSWNFNQQILISSKSIKFYDCYSEAFKTGSISDWVKCTH